MPASDSSCAVPPVDTISIPSSVSPFAKSTRPRLSETLKRARRIRTSPGCTTSVGLVLVASDIRSLLDQHLPWAFRIDVHGTPGQKPDRPGQQLVLDRVNCLLDRVAFRSIGKLEPLLQDDRAAVDPFVHEVDRDSADPNARVDRLLDGADARKRGQERGVHVDDPPLEPADEGAAEDLHEPREDEQVDLVLLQPIPESGVARRPVRIRARLEDARLDSGLARPPQAARLGPVRPDADHLDPLAPVDDVEDRLQVRPLAGDQHRDAVAHAATDEAGTWSTGYGPPVVSSRFCSISSSMRARMSARR